MWAGLTLSAGLVWLIPLVLAFLAVVYHAIVRWEETLLEARRGDEYRA
jgi:protein-S-isoprenylcysteine O-methyltransferase Ste14